MSQNAAMPFGASHTQARCLASAPAEILFAGGDLDGALRTTVQHLLDEVQAWDPDQLSIQSENEIVAYLAEKYMAHCPVLRRNDIYADEPVDVNKRVRDFGKAIAVRATRVRIHVPYDGERVFFTLKPNTFTLYPPIADVTDAEVVLTFEGQELEGERARAQLEHDLEQIEQWLSWARAMAVRHNASLAATALSAIHQRKEKLLRDRRTVASLGIPVRRRDDAANYAVSVTRRRPTVAKPPPSSTSYEPEPALSDSDYAEAIRVISSSSRQLERSPSTTLRLDEEERRDLLQRPV